jgi:hypothetical protein
MFKLSKEHNNLPYHPLIPFSQIRTKYHIIYAFQIFWGEVVNCEVSCDWRFQPLPNNLIKQEGFQLAEASFPDFRTPLRQVLPRNCLCWAASIASRSCLAWELRRGWSFIFIRACQDSTKLCLKLEITSSFSVSSAWNRFPARCAISFVFCTRMPCLHNVNPLTIRTFCKARKILSILWDGRRKRRSMQSGRLNADKTVIRPKHVFGCLWMSLDVFLDVLTGTSCLASWCSCSHIPTDNSMPDISQLSWPMFCSGT